MDGEEPFDPAPELNGFEPGAEAHLEGPHDEAPEAPDGGHGGAPGGDQREEELAMDRAAEAAR